MRYIQTIILLLAFVVAGCGDDQNNGDDSENNGDEPENCTLEMPLTGAVEETLSWGSAKGCGGASSGGLVTLTFGVLGESSVTMGPEVMPDETGEVATYVRYTDADGQEWTAQDCTLDVTRNEVIEGDLGETYVLAGTGTCAEAATATSGGADGEVTIGDFEFSNDQVPWDTE